MARCQRRNSRSCRSFRSTTAPSPPPRRRTRGAKTGETIYGAGTQIGENLLKLQDGAAKLTTGLQKATAGSAELAKGLNSTAVPGANKPAAGSETLATGLSGEFNDGMTQLNDGLEKLQAGSMRCLLRLRLNRGRSDVPDGFGRAEESFGQWPSCEGRR